MTIHDPEVVRREYASEEGLRARGSVYAGLAGPDSQQIAFEAVRDAPERVLDVACGWGELAAVASSMAHKHLAELVPEFDGPLVATRRRTVFVAERAT
jgi:2-polyprenyl-3-methyl-5-hydroxy-6-metoxy-1,4-benzoquinol methylase